MSKELEHTEPEVSDMPDTVTGVNGLRRTLVETDDLLAEIDRLAGPRRIGGFANRHTVVLGEERSENPE